jgi:hypothetical protein
LRSFVALALVVGLGLVGWFLQSLCGWLGWVGLLSTLFFAWWGNLLKELVMLKYLVESISYI